MLTFMLIFGVLSVLLGPAFGIYRSNKSKAISAPVTPKTKLSPPAKALVREYNALPADSRPFADIVSVLEDLDRKHAVDATERENHFNDNYFDLDPNLSSPGYRFTWRKKWSYSCGHSQYSSCRFAEYIGLHNTIATVAEALKAKERTLARSSADNDTLAELETRLRQEAELQNELTHEFNQLS